MPLDTTWPGSQIKIPVVIEGFIVCMYPELIAHARVSGLIYYCALGRIKALFTAHIFIRKLFIKKCLKYKTIKIYLHVRESKAYRCWQYARYAQD